jgi:lipopolysaccharide export system permease protein
MKEKVFDFFRLKTIDIYFIKKFLGTFFFSLGLILLIVVVFDLTEKLENFMEAKTPLNEILFTYYLNFIPYFANLFSPLFIFISVIFFTSKLTSNSEIVAILSSGISYPRLMRPYFFSALLLAILSFFLTGYLIPPANKKRIEFELKYIDKGWLLNKRNVHKQLLPGVFAFIETYDNSSDIGYNFTLEKFENDVLVSKLTASRVSWDSISAKWKMYDYYIRDYQKGNSTITSGQESDTTLNMVPKDFKLVLKSIETLNNTQLNEFIEDMEMRGDDNLEAYRVEKYRRYAFPFSTFILTLIGVSLATRKKRGGTGLNIAAGIALSFLYILFMQIFTEFAKANAFPTLLAVWIPNILFAIVAGFLYRIAPK